MLHNVPVAGMTETVYVPEYAHIPVVTIPVNVQCVPVHGNIVSVVLPVLFSAHPVVITA